MPKITLDLTELELRAMMHELWDATTRRCWYAMSSGRMFRSNNPAHFEDKIDDIQLTFKRRTLQKIRKQLQKQGVNTNERYALVYGEEIPEVKNFLVTNGIQPRCPEHKHWVKTEA